MYSFSASLLCSLSVPFFRCFLSFLFIFSADLFLCFLSALCLAALSYIFFCLSLSVLLICWIILLSFCSFPLLLFSLSLLLYRSLSLRSFSSLSLFPPQFSFFSVCLLWGYLSVCSFSALSLSLSLVFYCFLCSLSVPFLCRPLFCFLYPLSPAGLFCFLLLLFFICYHPLIFLSVSLLCQSRLYFLSLLSPTGFFCFFSLLLSICSLFYWLYLLLYFSFCSFPPLPHPFLSILFLRSPLLLFSYFFLCCSLSLPFLCFFTPLSFCSFPPLLSSFSVRFSVIFLCFFTLLSFCSFPPLLSSLSVRFLCQSLFCFLSPLSSTGFFWSFPLLFSSSTSSSFVIILEINLAESWGKRTNLTLHVPRATHKRTLILFIKYQSCATCNFAHAYYCMSFACPHCPLNRRRKFKTKCTERRTFWSQLVVPHPRERNSGKWTCSLDCPLNSFHLWRQTAVSKCIVCSVCCALEKTADALIVELKSMCVREDISLATDSFTSISLQSFPLHIWKQHPHGFLRSYVRLDRGCWHPPWTSESLCWRFHHLEMKSIKSRFNRYHHHFNI